MNALKNLLIKFDRAMLPMLHDQRHAQIRVAINNLEETTLPSDEEDYMEIKQYAQNSSSGGSESKFWTSFEPI